MHATDAIVVQTGNGAAHGSGSLRRVTTTLAGPARVRSSSGASTSASVSGKSKRNRVGSSTCTAALAQVAEVPEARQASSAGSWLAQAPPRTTTCRRPSGGVKTTETSTPALASKLAAGSQLGL